MGISMSCRPGLQVLIKVLLYDSYVAPGIGFLFLLSVSHIIVLQQNLHFKCWLRLKMHHDCLFWPISLGSELPGADPVLGRTEHET